MHIYISIYYLQSRFKRRHPARRRMSRASIGDLACELDMHMYVYLYINRCTYICIYITCSRVSSASTRLAAVCPARASW